MVSTRNWKRDFAASQQVQPQPLQVEVVKASVTLGIGRLSTILLEIRGATWVTCWTISQGKAWRSVEDALTFTCLTPLSGICIGCYLVSCIWVHMIYVLHHSSSWLTWRQVSKLEKFLPEAKTLCFNRLQVHRNQLWHVVWSLKSWVSYRFNRLQLFHNRLHFCLRQWLIYSRVFVLIDYQVDYLLLFSHLVVQKLTRTL